MQTIEDVPCISRQLRNWQNFRVTSTDLDSVNGVYDQEAFLSGEVSVVEQWVSDGRVKVLSHEAVGTPPGRYLVRVEVTGATYAIKSTILYYRGERLDTPMVWVAVTTRAGRSKLMSELRKYRCMDTINRGFRYRFTALRQGPMPGVKWLSEHAHEFGYSVNLADADSQ